MEDMYLNEKLFYIFRVLDQEGKLPKAREDKKHNNYF